MYSFKRVLLVLAAAFAGIVSYAQVTTSSLGGRVVDENGEPVPGAAIVATHTPSGTVYGVITNLDGRYTIQGMRTGGPYTVEVSSLGYQSVNNTGVTLQLGELYSLDATLRTSTEQLDEVVVVASPTSKFAAVQKTGATTNINNSQMMSLPSAYRDIQDMAKISPYAGSGMSLAGGDGRMTNFTVDGANFNNNFGLNDNLPGGGNPISIDAIEEMQVAVSPFDVRQTNFIGGGINAITKSGTNTFKGSAYVYHRNEQMRGDYIDGTAISGARDKQRTTTYGFTLGGPIIKNKLFFFVNWEQAKMPTVVNRWRGSEDGKMDVDKYISRAKLSDLQRVKDFLMDEYGYDTGSYTNFPAENSNNKFLARIDWNISQKHHLAVRYNITKDASWTGTNGNSMDPQDGNRRHNSFNRVSQYGMSYANSTYSTDRDVWSVSVDLNSRLSDKLSNQFLATYTNSEDMRGSNSSKFPFIDIMNGYTVDKSGTVVQTIEPYISAGYELFTWNNGVHSKTFNAKDDVTYFLGAHKITAGASYEHQMTDNAYMREGTGYYRYRSIDDFLAKAAPETVAITYGYDGELNPAARVNIDQIGLYVQDEWSATPRLTLTGGLRFDTILFNEKDIMTNNAIYALDFGGRHVDTGRWPTTKLIPSPRIGFTWDVLGDRSLKVRGGTGLFLGRLPQVFFTNMPTNSNMVQFGPAAYATYYKANGTVERRDSELDQFAGNMITDVDKLIEKLHSIDAEKWPTTISPEKGTIGGDIAGVDPKFKMPQVWKSSIAVDYNLPVGFPLSVTGEVIYTKTLNFATVVNWNIKDNESWARFTGADDRHMYPADFRYTDYNAYVLTNTNKGYGIIGNITINAQPVENLNIMAAYTRTVSKELTGLPGNNATSTFTGIPTVEGTNFTSLQNSSYVFPHKIIASVTYSDRANNHYSLFYMGTQANGFTYTYNGDMNYDGVSNDLIYIPKNVSEINFIDQDNADRFWSFLEQDKYLSSHKGEYAQAYSVFAPMRHTVNFKYVHDFKIKVGNTMNTLQLSADLINALNLFNDSWGVGKTWSPEITKISGKILTVDHVDGNGVPYFKTAVPAGAKTWDYYHAIGQCWYLQVGLRYMFN